MAMHALMTPTPPTGPKYSVLVVDDESDVREQLRIRFEMEGYRVFDADGGEAAYALVCSVRPDLVVTDIRMAKGTGTELLRRMHDDLKTHVDEPKHMPVVLCITGYSDLRLHDAYDFGAVAIFKKPFDMRDLMAASRRFLELREAEARATQMLGQFERDLRSLVEVTLRLGNDQSFVDNAPLDDLREVTAMILHEINRPLSVIAMNSSLLLSALQESPPRLPSAVKMATNVEAGCQKLVQISRSMRDLFLRNRSAADATYLANDLVQGALRQIEESGLGEGVKISVSTPERPIFINCSAPQLIQALINLIENGTHAAIASPVASVRVTIEEKNGFVNISVSDSGPGVPAAIRDRIFDPFFTTKGEQGSGMGLAVASKIADAHRGALTLSDNETGGAKFTLSLPTVKRS